MGELGILRKDKWLPSLHAANITLAKKVIDDDPRLRSMRCDSRDGPGER